jgi:dihydropteroate synthase
MTITLNQQLIDLNIPRIAAILNVTPDSFYDGGQLKNQDHLLSRVQEHIDQGAHIIDIGGYSTRPGATEVSIEEELSRVIPVVELLQEHFPNTPLSIDTFRSEVALKSLEKGAAMINDVTGSKADPKLLDVVASFQVPYIGMHMRGNPQTMNTLTDYEDIVVELRKHFSWLAEETAKRNLNDLIIDPGFGFAKTVEQNFFLLNHLDAFKLLKLPILVGLSRKSMIYKTLQTTPEEALNGTSALHMIALERGAHFLRVHDVKPAKECIDLYLKLKQSNT